MQVQSFTYMQAEYDTSNGGLDIDDINERENNLIKHAKQTV